MSDEHPAIRIFLGSVAAVSLPFAFFSGPVLRYVPAGSLAFAGLAIGVAAAWTWSAVRHHWGRAWEWPGLAILIVALASMTHLFNVAIEDSSANDRRCLAIQRDMLSSMPLRSDGPDLFQALGCHPQGGGSVYASRLDDDLITMFEKDARRAALPYRAYEKP